MFGETADGPAGLTEQRSVSALSMKLLVLTPEPIDAGLLRSVAGEEASDAEVMVVSPATHSSPLKFWMSDADEAIASAHRTAEETAERLEEGGIDAVGDAGEAEPVVARQDALATVAADRVIVFNHPEGSRDYREDLGLRDAEGRFGVPVTYAEISKELD
jgi:hypothetical protein